MKGGGEWGERMSDQKGHFAIDDFFFLFLFLFLSLLFFSFFLNSFVSYIFSFFFVSIGICSLVQRR